MRYHLMNKDALVLEFDFYLDEFEEYQAQEIKWHSDIRPFGYLDLTSFLERRKAPKHRKHIEELLLQYGCDDLKGFLDVTHALSLNDTFWVKKAGSSLHWKQVSLYDNEFNEIVAKAAFDGSVSSPSVSSTSPEFGTDGYYAKCWVKKDSGIYLYKTGSATFELEPFSEFFAAQLSEKICNKPLHYDLDIHHDKLVSTCKLFTSEKLGLAKISDVVSRDSRTISGFLKYYDSISCGDDFRRMCVLDAIILNTDRHLGNFGVLFDTDTMDVVDSAPVFDNNRSLLFDLDNDQLKNPDWYISKCTPRIGTDFIVTAKALMTDEIRKDLLAFKDFEFMQHEEIRISEERLELLNKIVQDRIKLLI